MVTRNLLVALILASSALAANQYAVKPFKIDLAAEIPRLKAQLAAMRLSARNPLSTLRMAWLTFNWAAEQKRLNSYRQYTTVINATTIHFVHKKSGKDGAIPIIITHGWPGSFNEYLPVVRGLLKSAEATLSTGAKNNVSFDVVIPLIPGYVFSSVPPTLEGRLLSSTAALWNMLMVDVLGYTRGYAVAGPDWGGWIAWQEYTLFPDTVRAAYINFFPWASVDSAQVAEENQTLSDFELFGVKCSEEWTTTGTAYYMEHMTKPNTIGLALQDYALGQLAWMGEKFYAWSDPQGQFTPKDVLTGVSLYFLTRTFLPSIFEYAHNPADYQPPKKANTTWPLGYGHFKWDTGHWPRYYIAQFANLTFYREHERGGHFPGMENSEAYVQDVRDFPAEHFVFDS
ncbi:alpha/beta-hydrolase [Auricularia subglabra TFB-10046 SS5]|nr:alpha/beta-hydrolase [Auricularia subglabra TFB-10046 SS5]